MNDQLQAQVSQILAEIMTSVGEVKDFSFAQLPDIAQQYISYGLWVNTFYAIGLVVFIIGLLVSIGFIVQLAKREHNSEILIFITFPIIFLIFSVGGLGSKIHDLILIHNAPKVWFILEIKNLLY
jgi:hypothetical protein